LKSLYSGLRKQELSSITEVCKVSYLLLLTRTPY